MTYKVLAPFKARTKEKGPVTIEPGQTVKLSGDMARRLMEEGKVEPLPRPTLDPQGDPRIPMNSAPPYRWWAGGQSVKETEEEVKGWLH